MRKAKLIAALLTMLLLVPFASGKEKKVGRNVEQEITALTDEIAQAQLKGDTNAYEKYYADDAVIIHASGARFTKAQEIENLKSGALKYETYDVHEREVHAYGDMAVATIRTTTKGVFNGTPFNGDFRVTRVWVRQKGNWKIVSFQVTRMAPGK